MATYAIGDLQGCLDPLKSLLEKIAFDPAADTLWFVGDLVNRGPQSLEALRFVRDLGDTAITVLGNHDLFLLACAFTDRSPKPGDTLDAILNAPDRDELIDWLRNRPLIHQDSQLGWTLVHAGIPPDWDLDTALAQAKMAQKALRQSDPLPFFTAMFGENPAFWHEKLSKTLKIRYTINALTRMRYVTQDGQLDLKEKRPIEEVGDKLLPWFDYPRRASRNERIVFGHWSALGEARDRKKTWCIDQGCLWGRELTALHLDTRPATVIQVSCPCYRQLNVKPPSKQSST
ncbi:symmetrical bis(5'-nucleosyl)-tetraphosphatase [Halothiobacillus sp.]|uniref:symmetrical bis(5'-nucleosyl)-tetraphosphatase n=1 Tax=Halothiobacillus sp. TaxID=1891311 RepID=UPI0026273391|nr:symmetrical bis(5'-nucleosyl)-tetraphosphatase [Halothiobacillus sp.]MDD4965568.1 symmetrical bis(5'-nucleosyl)-tetraphosphatase [Halothiobacillus sp.]